MHLLPNQFQTYWELRYKLWDTVGYGGKNWSIVDIKKYNGGAIITLEQR